MQYRLLLLYFNPLNTKLNPICHLLALLGAHHILHVSKVRVNVTWIFFTHFQHIKISNFIKIRQWNPRCFMWTDGRTDGQTDRQTDMTKINSHFAIFWKRLTTLHFPASCRKLIKGDVLVAVLLSVVDTRLYDQVCMTYLIIHYSLFVCSSQRTVDSKINCSEYKF
jgi:hypothetical protein